MVKPEKCLHCGGEAQIYSHIVFEYRGEDYRKHWNGDKYYVRCENCGIQTQDYYTEQEACDVWNRRTQPEQSQVVHGRWIKSGQSIHCSICHRPPALQTKTKFCPSCGAKMDGGEKDAAD